MKNEAFDLSKEESNPGQTEENNEKRHAKEILFRGNAFNMF